MVMRTRYRFVLTLILSLFLAGMAAHSLPEGLLCDCFSSPEEFGGAPAADACLVCLLESGVYNAGVQPPIVNGCTPPVAELSGPDPQKHAQAITHPPASF